MKKSIEISINAFDLVGKKYRVTDNSYASSLSGSECVDLYGKEFTIISIPFKGIVPDSNRNTYEKEVILNLYDYDNTYRVLFSGN